MRSDEGKPLLMPFVTCSSAMEPVKKVSATVLSSKKLSEPPLLTLSLPLHPL